MTVIDSQNSIIYIINKVFSCLSILALLFSRHELFLVLLLPMNHRQWPPVPFLPHLYVPKLGVGSRWQGYSFLKQKLWLTSFSPLPCPCARVVRLYHPLAAITYKWFSLGRGSCSPDGKIMDFFDTFSHQFARVLSTSIRLARPVTFHSVIHMLLFQI